MTEIAGGHVSPSQPRMPSIAADAQEKPNSLFKAFVFTNKNFLFDGH